MWSSTNLQCNKSELKHHIKAHRGYSCKKGLPEAVCKTKCLRGEQRVGRRKLSPGRLDEEHQNNKQLGKSRWSAKFMILQTQCGIFKNSQSTFFSLKSMGFASQLWMRKLLWEFGCLKKASLVIASRMVWKGQILELRATNRRDFVHTHIYNFIPLCLLQLLHLQIIAPYFSCQWN